MKNYLCWVLSLVLHVSTLYILSMHLVPKVEGQEKAQENGIGQPAVDHTAIVPKVIEVTIQVEDRAGPGKRKPIKASKEGLKDCKDNEWFGGIGVYQDGVTGIVNQVFKGYPADAAGISQGDVIITPVQDEIKGAIGSSIKLIIFRPKTGETFTLNLIRAKICTEEL
jgi:S1-C subfamily serine protease